MSSLLSLQQDKELIIQLIISLLKERAFYVRAIGDAIFALVGADIVRDPDLEPNRGRDPLLQDVVFIVIG